MLALAVAIAVVAGTYRCFRYGVGSKKLLGLAPVGLWLLAVVVVPLLLAASAVHGGAGAASVFWSVLVVGQTVAAAVGIVLYLVFEPDRL